MAYTVATSRPCEFCGTPTCRRRERTRQAMCLDCGIARMVDAATLPELNYKAGRKRYLEGVVRWADGGGIDRTEQPAKWRAKQRRYVAECRAELEQIGGPSPQSA